MELLRGDFRDEVAKSGKSGAKSQPDRRHRLIRRMNR